MWQLMNISKRDRQAGRQQSRSVIIEENDTNRNRRHIRYSLLTYHTRCKHETWKRLLHQKAKFRSIKNIRELLYHAESHGLSFLLFGDEKPEYGQWQSCYDCSNTLIVRGEERVNVPALVLLCSPRFISTNQKDHSLRNLSVKTALKMEDHLPHFG